MNTGSNDGEGGNGSGVQNGSETTTATVAEMEDDVFTAEAVSECQQRERRQPSREELRLPECRNDHNGTNRSPLASPVRQRLTPSLPTLLEGQ